jgi:hypothetical protein
MDMPASLRGLLRAMCQLALATRENPHGEQLDNDPKDLVRRYSHEWRTDFLR